MKSRLEIKKNTQKEQLGTIHTLMAKLEAKGYSVAEVTKKANITGNKLYELLREEPRGFNNAGDIIEKLGVLLNADIDINIDDYKSINAKLEEINQKQDLILSILLGK